MLLSTHVHFRAKQLINLQPIVRTMNTNDRLHSSELLVNTFDVTKPCSTKLKYVSAISVTGFDMTLTEFVNFPNIELFKGNILKLVCLVVKVVHGSQSIDLVTLL